MQVQARRHVQVDAVGLAGEAQFALLAFFLPVLQRFDVAAAVQAAHGHLADIADGEVAVQCLAQRQRRRAEVVAGQVEVQAFVEADVQLDAGRVRPVGQRLLAAVEGEAQVHGPAFAVDALQLPVQRAHAAVEGRGAQVVVLRLQRQRVAAEVAEPGPAHRHPAAHRLLALVGGLFAEPDQRRLLATLVTQ